jgi:hypothetical protein
MSAVHHVRKKKLIALLFWWLMAAVPAAQAQSPLPDPLTPRAGGPVYSLATQGDGKILVGGNFTTLGGQRRSYLGRLNANGTLDSRFNPGAHLNVSSLAVQADGKVLVGGWFSQLAGQRRNGLGRLNNTEPATQSLRYDGSKITWLRSGASPEVWRTTFAHSADDSAWTSLGPGTRITGGWQLSDVSLPPAGIICARGYVTGGYNNASGWFVETTIGVARPIWLSVVRAGSNVVLSWTGGQGPYQVQQTTHLGDSISWENVGAAAQTNSMTLPIGPGNLFLRVCGQ